MPVWTWRCRRPIGTTEATAGTSDRGNLMQGVGFMVIEELKSLKGQRGNSGISNSKKVAATPWAFLISP